MKCHHQSSTSLLSVGQWQLQNIMVNLGNEYIISHLQYLLIVNSSSKNKLAELN